MDVRTRIGSYLCLLVAVSATGCETLRGTRADRVVTQPSVGTPRPDPTQPLQPWPGQAPTAPTGPGQGPAPGAPTQLPPISQPPGDVSHSEGIGGGLVVAASGANPLGTPVGTPSNAQQPGAPLAQPRPVSQNAPGAPNGQPPTMTPPVNPSGYAAGDPHLRIAPTVSGGRWGLNPNETPADKLLELTRNLESAMAQNRDLVARIKELETLGTGREQSLAEAARELDAVNAQAARIRSELQAQVTFLQNKIEDLENEQIEFLKAAIKVLERRAPLGGK